MNNRKHQQYFVIVCAVLAMLASCGRKVAVTEYAIVPEPVFMSSWESSFALTRSTKLYAENIGQNDNLLKYVTSKIRQWRINPSFVGVKENNCVRLIVNEEYDSELGDEGYELHVDKDSVVLRANSEKGLFYAFQTFEQMLPADIGGAHYGNITLPACHVRDHPRFEWRGLRIDDTYKILGVNQMKHLIDLMASYKLNKLHWRIVSKDGWRVEMDNYPLLTTMNIAVRDGNADSSTDVDYTPNVGFYTKEEISDIVTYAAERFIEIVPEIDLPASCGYVISSYPRLICNEPQTSEHQAASRIANKENNDSALFFMKNIVGELDSLFPGRYIHLSGDMTTPIPWQRCSLCGENLEKHGFKNVFQIYAWAVSALSEQVLLNDKVFASWDGVAMPGMTDANMFFVQRGASSLTSLFASGKTAMATADESLNLDKPDANVVRGKEMPSSQVVTMRRLYVFDPLYGLSDEKLGGKTFGVEASVSTQPSSWQDDVEKRLLPRLLAVAEMAWSSNREWTDFERRVAIHKSRLLVKGCSVGEGAFVPRMTAELMYNDSVRVSFDVENEGAVLYYKTQNANYTQYTEHLMLRSGDSVKTLIFKNGRLREKEYEFVIP